MKNYKIKVNSKEESIKAQDLLFKLGYQWPFSKTDHVWLSKPWLSTSPTGVIRWHDENDYSEFYRCELITLSKLKDLVEAEHHG